MSDAIQFFIPLVPVAQQSISARVATSSTGKQFVATYQPKEKREYKSNIVMLAAKHRPPAPWEGPVKMSLRFIFPWLKSHGRKLREAPRVWRSTKPDFDNLSKPVCDALEKCGYVLNDSQLCCVSVEKVYGDSPGTWVTLEQLA